MEDLEKIDSIYRKYYADEYQLPDLTNTIGSGVISSETDIIGFGMVRLAPEAIIVIDKSKNLLDKFHAIELLFSEAKKACSSAGFNELYAKIIDDKYMNMLIKRFGFKALDGKLLVKILGD